MIERKDRECWVRRSIENNTNKTPSKIEVTLARILSWENIVINVNVNRKLEIFILILLKCKYT